MATTTRFLEAVDNSRPYKSHRYDVFGLKIGRGMTLFGRTALDVWVLLESQPSVISYCERPLVVPDTRPKRVIDFWVRFQDREKLWIVLRSRELDSNSNPSDTMPAFTTWAASKKLIVRFIDPVDSVARITYLDNWGRILRELSSSGRFVTPAMRQRVRECIDTERPMGALNGLLPDVDPVLLRTAAFSLVHSGQIRCTNIAEQPLGPASILEAV